jgi:hypothetical protein
MSTYDAQDLWIEITEEGKPNTFDSGDPRYAELELAHCEYSLVFENCRRPMSPATSPLEGAQPWQKVWDAATAWAEIKLYPNLDSERFRIIVRQKHLEAIRRQVAEFASELPPRGMRV